MTPKRASKRDRNKTMKRTSDKKTTIAASTMNNDQDHNATEEEISLVSPGAVPVPGTGSSLGPPNHGAEENASESFNPRLAAPAPSLVVAAPVVTHHNDEYQPDEDFEHRIEHEVESRLKKHDAPLVAAEVLPPVNSNTAQAACKQFLWRWKYVLLFIALGMCGAIAGVVIWSSRRSDETSSPDVPSTAIDKNPTTSLPRSDETPAKIIEILRQANLTIDQEPTGESPQYYALDWLQFADTNNLMQNGIISDIVVLQRYSLAVLYYSTSGNHWTNKRNFLRETDVCNWNDGSDIPTDEPTSGVHCGADAKVEQISLGHNGLNGTIPSELSILSNLRVLRLHGNVLGNTIPTALGRLTALSDLQVHENRLRWKLPSELGQLAALETLNLSYNKFWGPLPTELGRLTTLEILNVAWNEMTGPIPTELGLMKSLINAFASFNTFTGTLPTQLGRLTALENLFVICNHLNGTMPAQLQNNSNVQVELDPQCNP